MTQEIDVRVGEVAEVRLQVDAVAAKVPYHETMTASGRIMCSAAVWQPTDAVANNQPIGVCNAVGTGYETIFSIETLQDVSGFWIDTTWDSTQAAGDGFTTFWPFRGEVHLGNMATMQGSDPISGPITPDRLAEALAENDQHNTTCDGDGCSLHGRHFTYANTLGNAYPVDFSVQVDQTYDDYVTIFYGDFPVRFTALPDA